MIKTYKLRPVELDAMQWDGSETSGLEIVKWVRSTGGFAKLKYPAADDPKIFVEVHTVFGSVRLRRMDWLIQDINGAYFPCEPSIFRHVYMAKDSKVVSATRRYQETLRLSIATLDSSHQKAIETVLNPLLNELLDLAHKEENV